MLASTLDLSGKTVTLPSGTGGKVLQVVQGTYSTSLTLSNTWASTGLSASITPSASSNKVLMLAFVPYTVVKAANDYISLEYDIQRDGTSLKHVQLGGYSSTYIQMYGAYNCSLLDSPATTSSVTYSLNARSQGATDAYALNGGTANDGSSIILMEVSA